MNAPETWWEFAILGPDPIVPVEVHKVTAKIVYVKRPRINALQRVWRAGQIFRTYEEARAALLAKAQDAVKRQRRVMQLVEDRLAQVMALPERNPNG